MAAPRLRLLGIRVPRTLGEPEIALFSLLTEQHGDAAHGRYNALVRRIVAFQRAALVVSPYYSLALGNSRIAAPPAVTAAASDVV